MPRSARRPLVARHDPDQRTGDGATADVGDLAAQLVTARAQGDIDIAALLILRQIDVSAPSRQESGRGRDHRVLSGVEIGNPPPAIAPGHRDDRVASASPRAPERDDGRGHGTTVAVHNPPAQRRAADLRACVIRDGRPVAWRF